MNGAWKAPLSQEFGREVRHSLAGRASTCLDMNAASWPALLCHRLLQGLGRKLPPQPAPCDRTRVSIRGCNATSPVPREQSKRVTR
eukprot:scaffold7331_cov403-Prasinococcus_capsulatus_cf.AAC.5